MCEGTFSKSPCHQRPRLLWTDREGNVMQPMPFDPSPPPPKKLPFALSWLITVPVAVLLLIELRVQLPLARASMKTDQAMAFVMGRFIGGLLFSLLIAWVAWLVGRRSRFAANWGFGIVM